MTSRAPRTLRPEPRPDRGRPDRPPSRLLRLDRRDRGRQEPAADRPGPGPRRQGVGRPRPRRQGRGPGRGRLRRVRPGPPSRPRSDPRRPDRRRRLDPHPPGLGPGAIRLARQRPARRRRHAQGPGRAADRHPRPAREPGPPRPRPPAGLARRLRRRRADPRRLSGRPRRPRRAPRPPGILAPGLAGTASASGPCSPSSATSWPPPTHGPARPTTWPARPTDWPTPRPSGRPHSTASPMLYESDRSAQGLLEKVARKLAPLADAVPEFADASADLARLADEAREVAYALRRLGQGWEDDPARLEEVEARLALYRRLASRFRCEPDELADPPPGDRIQARRDRRSRGRPAGPRRPSPRGLGRGPRPGLGPHAPPRKKACKAFAKAVQSQLKGLVARPGPALGRGRIRSPGTTTHPSDRPRRRGSIGSRSSSPRTPARPPGRSARSPRAGRCRG